MENQKTNLKITLLIFFAATAPLITPFYSEYNYKVILHLAGYYIGLFPLIFSFFYKKKNFLVFELHCFYYSLFFFLIPIIYIKTLIINYEIFYLTSLISISGLLILIITFYTLNFFNFKKKNTFFFKEEINLHILYYIFLIIFLFFKLFFNSNSMIYFYFLIGLNYYIILSLKYEKNKIIYILLVIQNIILFFYTIFDFVYMDSLFFLITLLLVKWFFQKRINWFFVIIILIIIFFGSGVKNIFRYAQNLDSKNKIENNIISKRFYQNLQYGDEKYLDQNFSTLRQRLTYPYLSLINSVRITPKDHPYLQGESYLPIFFKFLPSLIFKHQYQENFGNKFGRLYGFASIEDFNTSFNVPFITEFYINFGIIGVALGMFFIGFFFYILENFFISKKKKNNLTNLIILTCSVPLCIPESNLSLMLGAFLQNLLIIFIVIFFFIKIFFVIRNKFI